MRCCLAAYNAGIYPGMPLAEARAVLPHARTAPFDPARSHAALTRLALWATRYSPAVMVDPTPLPRPRRTHLNLPTAPDGILLDITGAAHLFGGEPLLLHDFRQRLARNGLAARLAAAPTIGAAWALARFGPHPLATLDQPQLADALAPLPVHALRLDPLNTSPTHTIQNTLQQVGIERVGQLLALPRESLAARFGPDLLLRIDQALGRAAEPLTPLKIPAPLEAARHFEAPITDTTTVMLAAQELLEALCRELLARESGMRELELELRFNESRPQTTRLVLGRPTRNHKHLWALLKPRLETLTPQALRNLENTNLTIGVEAVTLRAPIIARLRHGQITLDGTTDNPAQEAVSEFLDTVANRIGPNRVLRLHPVDTHVPERAVKLTEAITPGDGEHVIARIAPAQPHPESPFRGGLAMSHRPSTLLDAPESADVIALTPDGPPRSLHWRSRHYTIIAAVGPERIGGEWWKTTPPPPPPAAPTPKPPQAHAAAPPIPPPDDPVLAGALTFRDYFKIQTAEGAWLWVYRNTVSNRWFVHGLWS